MIGIAKYIYTSYAKMVIYKVPNGAKWWDNMENKIRTKGPQTVSFTMILYFDMIIQISQISNSVVEEITRNKPTTLVSTLLYLMCVSVQNYQSFHC